MKKIKLSKTARIPIAYTAKHKVLPYIEDFITDIGYPPGINEIGEAFGKTGEWARLIIKELVKQKLIKVRKGAKRGLVVIKK